VVTKNIKDVIFGTKALVKIVSFLRAVFSLKNGENYAKNFVKLKIIP
jgi:hypothetical protein